MQVYVKADSKKALNERLAKGDQVYATEYRMGSEELYILHGEGLEGAKLRDGAVVKIYSRTIQGTPYAKAYGVWDASRRRVK